MSLNHKTSIYCSAFNVASPQCNFDYKRALRNFAEFADEVVCATFECEDKSHELLRDMERELPNLRVIVTGISTANRRWDGGLKTAALQATTNPVKILMDCDEIIPLSNKPRWDAWIDVLMAPQNAAVDGLFIPTLDCWGDEKKIRANTNIGVKFRVHKDTVKTRGVVPWAEKGDGLWNVSQSDCTEPMLQNGRLAKFAQIVPPQCFMPLFSRQLKDYPHVLHNGYVSLEARIKLNRAFWKDTWASYSGHEENVATDITELEKEATIEHGLPLE